MPLLFNVSTSGFRDTSLMDRARLVTESWQDAAGLRRRVISSRRHVQILPLLIAVCRITVAFPTQTPSADDNVQQLQVNIPDSGPISAPLGSSISIPCLVSLSSSSPAAPRVKWTVVSGGVETQILVARDQRVKVNEAFRDRAAWLNYTSSPEDLSLWLGDLRSSDSGFYRCEVQQGLEDASDIVQLKVKGVVFHYRDALGRYAFSFHQAQRACEAIGAQITTPDQLLAAYYDGYEQCDAGWLADQSVRYPIQVPREGCYGDMDGQPGVRNYGTMNPDHLFDVYCYLEESDGEVFHDPIPQQLSFDEAQSYCRAAGAELASTAQLYLAWTEGLDHCSPGWLADGSVRYPIITPRERCGGPQPGVKTVYRFSNQTGFPEPSSLHDVYCFRDNINSRTDSPVGYMATQPEDIGQDVVILMEKDHELQLNQRAEQVELKAQTVVESFPFFSSSFTEENLVDTHQTVISDTTQSPLNITPTLDLLEAMNETLSPTEMSSQHPTALINSTFSTTETHSSPQNMSFLLDIHNETDSHHNLNFTFDESEPEITTGFPEPSYEPPTYNQTVVDTTPKDNTSERPEDSHKIQDASLDFNRSQANYSEAERNHTRGESSWEVISVTLDPVVQVKLDKAEVEDSVQMFVSTQASKEEGIRVTQPAQTTKMSMKELSSSDYLDGSGDISQERHKDVEAGSFIPTSESFTSSFTTHPSSSASASSASAEPQTALTEPTLSFGSRHSDKLGFDILSTAPQLWESSISRQEGSTSLEIEDTVTLESEGKQLHPTTSEYHPVSGISLAITESPERSNSSQMPTDYSIVQYETSGYRVYSDATTNEYEEASGDELPTVTATLDETVKVAPTVGKNVSQIVVEENKVNQTLWEVVKVASTLKGEVVFPTLEEEDEVSFSPEEEVIAPTLALQTDAYFATTLEEGSAGPYLEKEANVSPVLEKKFNVTLTFVEQARIASSHEEQASKGPTLEEEANNGPTLEEEVSNGPTLEEEASIGPTLAEEASIGPTLAEEASIGPTLEEEASNGPTFEEEASIGPTLEEEVSNGPTLEEEASIGPTLEEEASNGPTLEEEASNGPTLEEESNIAPTFDPDFTVFTLDSQTSDWALLTTTTGPQESLKDLEYSRKNTPITSTTAPESSSTPNAFHKTAEPQKETSFIPPVGQGLVDAEFSLTQPPTLLNLPNERAAVGGAGKASDACVEDPCLNGGTCTDRGGQIQCLCLPTYGGDFCQTDLEHCEPGWDKFHGFCYRHFGQRLSWQVAELHCRMLGAHLVSIITPEEQSYINNNYKEYQWTGLNDKTIEDDFRWSDGNPLLYENWYKGQPDSYFLSGEDCVVMVWHDDGRWSDVPCNYHLAYTCKKGTSSCGPPPKVQNASIFGKVRQKYETDAVVRFHCAEGFQQRLNPLIRCLSGGRWERPHILCIPEAGGPTQHLEVTSQSSSNSAAIKDFEEFEATKETPQYWEIKF
ncbi:Brevican core protein [Dissostichus eleginoides]|uniref:Brevican core protein n=1 Tax=Dissostichus eleginoides TaxID=100907 RepID=A0AAD9EVZ8_DISEL|nr:Brevican core protein [Dissostichus eleginoides]